MAVYYQPGYRLDKFRDEREDCNHKHHKYDCECKRCRRDHDCYTPIDCRPDKVVFKCNNITGASGINIIAIGDVVVPRNIGSVSVPELCCFKQPCVKIDISAIITLSAAIAVGTTITFRVFKRCGTEQEVEIQSFDITEGLALDAGSTIPVSLSVCDCNSDCHSNCCVYRVTVEATAAAAVATAINVNQGTISVTASDVC